MIIPKCYHFIIEQKRQKKTQGQSFRTEKTFALGYCNGIKIVGAFIKHSKDY
jgi:hypothetical protein